MTIFISGGCKNGKSSIAERLLLRLAGDCPRYYVATMIPHDEEDRQRIRRHVEERADLQFETIECGTHIDRCTAGREDGAFLLDRLGNVFGYIKSHYRIINKVCGMFLVVTGVLMATGLFEKILSVFGG